MVLTNGVRDDGSYRVKRSHLVAVAGVDGETFGGLAWFRFFFPCSSWLSFGVWYLNVQATRNFGLRESSVNTHIKKCKIIYVHNSKPNKLTFKVKLCFESIVYSISPTDWSCKLFEIVKGQVLQGLKGTPWKKVLIFLCI